MGEVQEADFYDSYFREYKSGLLESNWLGLYVLVAGWLESRVNSVWDGEVLDLGCGNGHFAELLWARGFRKPYVGLDFSAEAIHRASQHVLNPHFHFYTHDLRHDFTQYLTLPQTAVCLETLEHLQDDKEMLDRLGTRKHVIFSVPNYDSEGHVRHFTDEQSVYDRYKDIMTFRRLGLVDLSPPTGRRIIVAEGWIR